MSYHHGPATIIEQALTPAERDRITALRDQIAERRDYRSIWSSNERRLSPKAFYAIGDDIQKLEDAIGDIHMAVVRRLTRTPEQMQQEQAHV